MLAELVGALPRGSWRPSRELLEKYRQDRARDPTRARRSRWCAPRRPRRPGGGALGRAAPGAGGAARRRHRPVRRGDRRRRRHRAVAPSGCATIAIDPVDPGRGRPARALNAEVKEAAAEHGLWYPPDPSSFEICSIGGNVATNAGGLCCVKYGVTTDYVLGHGGRAGRRHGGAPRRAAAQGRRRAVADEAVRRERGHARHHHRGRPCGCCPRSRRRRRSSRRSPDRRRAADAVLAITATMRRRCSNSWTTPRSTRSRTCCTMGLDRDAGALLLARSDAPATGRRATRSPLMRGGLRDGRRHRGVHHRRPGRGRGVRRRPAGGVPRAGAARAACCSRTSACRCPALPELIAGVEAIAARHRRHDRRRSPTPATATPTR